MRDELLPPLPRGDDAASSAIRSVHGRGFYDLSPSLVSDRHLMAQMIRLGEEIGEYREVVRASLNKRATHIELVDVFIVLAQLYWLTGGAVDTMVYTANHMRYAGTTLEIEFGQLCRAVRKANSDFRDIQTRLLRMASLCMKVMEQGGGDFEREVRGKLVSDEARGVRHEGIFYDRG